VNKIFIGIDNGVTGSIAILKEGSNSDFTFIKTPVKKELNYTKTKAYINRIEVIKLKELFSGLEGADFVMALIERPMVNPTRWVASVSAIRALEATQGVLEQLGIPYAFIDSKEWQKALLPSGLKGDELKTASLAVGKRLYPSVTIKHPDNDGLLIAHYCKQKYK
jgi:hypothetical protein